MANSLQSTAQPSLDPNHQSPSCTGLASGDTSTGLVARPPSDLPAPASNAQCAVECDVSGHDAGNDQSRIDQPLKEPATSPDLRPGSPMTTTPPGPDPSSDSPTVVTATTEADRHSVPPSAVDGSADSSEHQPQDPRPTDPQPNGSESVPPSTSQQPLSSCHVEETCPAPATGSIESPHSPSLVPSVDIASGDENPMTSASGAIAQASVEGISATSPVAVLALDHPSMAVVDHSGESSAPAAIESSVEQKPTLPEALAPQVADPLLQSSPTPTTSTSQPSSHHQNSDRGSEPPVVQQPSQGPITSPRPSHSAPPQEVAIRPFDPQHHPAEPTSSVSSPLSPISKRPSSPIMAPDSSRANGYNDASPSQHLRANGNGLPLASESSNKRQRLDQEPPYQNGSSGTRSSNLGSASASLPSYAAPNGLHTNPHDSHSALASGSQAEWLVPGTPGTSFTRQQHRFVCSVLRELKKQRDAAPFLRPVDVLTYYDYPTVVKQPMDLSTVDTRLGKPSKPCYYTSVEQFVADVQLIFNNCYMYNGSPDVATISHMALTLSLLFESQMKKLPTDNPIPNFSSRSPSLAKPKVNALPSHVASTASGVNRKISTPVTGAPVASTSAPSGQKRRSSSPQHPRKKSTKTTAYSTPSGGLQHVDEQFASTAVGAGRRNSAAIDSSGPRLQNFINPSITPSVVSNAKAELKFCREVLKEVNKKTLQRFVWPFYEPVDPLRLGIPDYFNIIQKPMDLSTMKKKLDRDEYATGAAFAGDFRLMLFNCFKFNPVGTPVYNLGKELERWFEAKWLERPPDVIAAPIPVASVNAPQHNVPPVVDEIEKIKYDLELLTERLARETARKEGTLVPSYPVGTGPPNKKPSVPKGASAAKNLSNSHAASGGSASASGQPSKSNGGSKAKAGGTSARKKSVPASGAQASAAAKRQIQQQQQLTERNQNLAQLYQQQQQQAAAAAATSAYGYHNPLSMVPGAPEHFEKIDYEQKKELATLIQNAVEPMQSQAINLIRAAHPDLVTPDGEEIELDIDALDDRTLYRLYRLVCDTAPVAQPPVAPPLPAAAAPAKKKKPSTAPRRPAAGTANGGKPNTVKKKPPPRKAIDENHETEKIKRLEQNLHAFDETAAVSAVGLPPSHPAPVPPPQAGSVTAPPPSGHDFSTSSSESDSESDDDSD